MVIEFWKNFGRNVKSVLVDLFGKDKEKRKKQIPNALTLIRGIVAPITIIPCVICSHIYNNMYLIYIAFALIAICALTDSFDGWYARKYNAESEFGALLDAICDKLFVVTLAFPLAFVYPRWIVIILVLELIISIINAVAQLKGFKPKSSIIGKIKTAVLDSSVALCYLDFFVTVPKFILDITSISTNILQLLSIWGYHKEFRKNTNAEL